jgi:hypothetical protein
MGDFVSDGQEQLCGSRRQVASLKGVDARIHEVPALDSAVDSSTATQIHRVRLLSLQLGCEKQTDNQFLFMTNDSFELLHNL